MAGSRSREGAENAQAAQSTRGAQPRPSGAPQVRLHKTLTVTSNPKRSAVTQRPVTVSPVTSCYVLLLRANTGVYNTGSLVDGLTEGEYLGHYPVDDCADGCVCCPKLFLTLASSSHWKSMWLPMGVIILNTGRQSAHGTRPTKACLRMREWTPRQLRLPSVRPPSRFGSRVASIGSETATCWL